MCIVIVSQPNCDVINFEINGIFLIKPFLLHDQKVKTKISWEQEDLLRWNKKHFSPIFRNFQHFSQFFWRWKSGINKKSESEWIFNRLWSKWSKSIEQLHSRRWSDTTDGLALLRHFRDNRRYFQKSKTGLSLSISWCKSSKFEQSLNALCNDVNSNLCLHESEMKLPNFVKTLLKAGLQ